MSDFRKATPRRKKSAIDPRFRSLRSIARKSRHRLLGRRLIISQSLGKTFLGTNCWSPELCRPRRSYLPNRTHQDGLTVSMSGQHFSGTSFLLDGTTNRDPLEGIVVLNPSLESVSEIKVTTQNFSADVG